jgi:hypothetical protein
MAATLRKQPVVIRRALLLGALLASIAMIGGADRTSASTEKKCTNAAPSGRLFCVTVIDLDGVSPSGLVGSGAKQVDVNAYHFYKLTIENIDGSMLTNGTATLVLTDQLSTDASVTSTAVFNQSASAPFCSPTSTDPNIVTCSIANIPGGETKPEFVIGYRTSSTPDVVSTKAAVTVAFKEGENSGANPASLKFDETTSLEPNPQSSVAWSPPEQDVTLGTSPAFDSQFSVLQYKVPAGKKPFVATLAESDGYVCHASLTCFGELVTTDLTLADPTSFSTSNPFHITMKIGLDLVPGGNTNFVVMSHKPEVGPIEIISTRCSANPPAATDTLPCITVTKDNKLKLLVIDIYAFENGGWMPG